MDQSGSTAVHYCHVDPTRAHVRITFIGESTDSLVPSLFSPQTRQHLIENRKGYRLPNSRVTGQALVSQTAEKDHLWDQFHTARLAWRACFPLVGHAAVLALHVYGRNQVLRDDRRAIFIMREGVLKGCYTFRMVRPWTVVGISCEFSD